MTSAQPKRKTTIRAINAGTSNDATGRAKRWIRLLETGKLGRVTDVMVTARVLKGDQACTECFQNGTGGAEIFHYIASVHANRLLPR